MKRRKEIQKQRTPTMKQHTDQTQDTDPQCQDPDAANSIIDLTHAKDGKQAYRQLAHAILFQD